MTSLILVNTQVTETTANHVNHRELESTTQVVPCTSLSDATTKLQTALTAIVGSGTATTHANAFNARQTAALNPSKHAMNLGAGAGMTARYIP